MVRYQCDAAGLARSVEVSGAMVRRCDVVLGCVGAGSRGGCVAWIAVGVDGGSIVIEIDEAGGDVGR